MAEIEFLNLPEINFDNIKPEDGPRLGRALQEVQDKVNEVLKFLKDKFPGEV